MSNNSQTKDYALCLGNFSKDFTINLLKRTALSLCYNGSKSFLFVNATKVCQKNHKQKIMHCV